MEEDTGERDEGSSPRGTAVMAGSKPGTVLVTGGAGFIGSHVCLALRRRYPTARVVALDNLHRRGSELQVPRLLAAGVEFIHGDVRNLEDLAQVGACDLVIEAAAECSVLAGVGEEPGYVIRSNLIGAINCLDFARSNGAGVILLSSSRVYPIARLRAFELETVGERYELVDSRERRGVTEKGVTERFPMDGERTLYGASKYAAELLAQEYFGLYGVPGLIDRCGVIAGPWQMAKVDQGVVGLWCARHVYGGKLNYIGHGGYQVRDILHIDDLVELILKQIEVLPEISGEVFNVGGGREISVSLRELTSLCSEISGRHLDIGTVDEERYGDVPLYYADCSKVNQATGWAPKIGVRRIVEETCEWIESHLEELRTFLAS